MISLYWSALLVLLAGLFRPLVQIEPAYKEIRFAPWDLVTAIAWSPDGNYVAAAVGTRVILFPARQETPIVTMQQGVLTTSLAFSPDSAWLAAGGRDGKVRLFLLPVQTEEDMDLGPQRVIKAHRKGVNTLQFSPEGEWLASGGNDAVVRLWDWENGRLVNEIIGGTYSIPAIVFINQEMLAVANGKFIRLRNVHTDRFSGSFKTSNPVFSLAVNSDGRWLLMGDIENGVQLWEVSTAYRTGMENYPQSVFQAAHTGHPGTYQSLVWDVQFHPEGHLIASAGGDGSIIVWDFLKRERVHQFVGHQAAVTSLAFSPDGRWLVSGGLDASIRYWPLDGN
jgi:WD40 repeat protein